MYQQPMPLSNPSFGMAHADKEPTMVIMNFCAKFGLGKIDAKASAICFRSQKRVAAI
jgi:hypothetical protein